MTNIPNAFSMGYYPDGRRAWKMTGGVKYYYIYDGDTVVYEMNGSGVATNLFGYGAAGLAQRKVGGTSLLYHYSFDPSGNVVQRHQATTVTVSGGPLLADFTTLYDGFGQQLGSIASGTGAQASAAGSEMIGFAGQFGCWTDNETSMNPIGGAPNRRFLWVWMGHREYDPLACRFLTRDPIGYDGGINLYAYAGNNPINFADPSGLDALILWGTNKANPDFFKDLALIYADQYEVAHGKHSFVGDRKFATVAQASSIEDIQAALEKTKDIDTIIYVGHAGAGALYLSKNELLVKDVSKLLTKNVKKGARISLLGCSTGDQNANGPYNITQAFANQFKTTVTGVKGGLSFGLPIKGPGGIVIADLNEGCLRPDIGFVTAMPGGTLGAPRAKAHKRR